MILMIKTQSYLVYLTLPNLKWNVMESNDMDDKISTCCGATQSS